MLCSLFLTDVSNVNDGNQRILQRMEKKLFDLAKLPDEEVLPATLRPDVEKSSAECSTAQNLKHPDKLSGNFIGHIGSTETAFNRGIRENLKERPNCKGDIILDPATYQKMGLGLRAGLKCTECDYTHIKMKFYEEVRSEKRGNKAVKMNIHLQVALTKEPIGNSTIRSILSTLDIDPPSESSMQDMANSVGEAFIDINERQLAANRNIIGDVMKVRRGDGESGPPSIAVAADGAYNNPPKGRGFYQPGTQSRCPMMCMEEGLDMPVAFATRSKLCSCPRAKAGIHLSSCSKTFSNHVAMGNSEKEMGKDCGEQINGSKVTIGTIIADGDGHVVSGVKDAMPQQEVEKQNCARHLTKSVGRNITKQALECFPGPTQVLKKQQLKALSKFVEKRCSWEYREAHRRYGKQINLLISKCAMMGIIANVEGDGETCRRVSLVCKAHSRRLGVNRANFG